MNGIKEILVYELELNLRYLIQVLAIFFFKMQNY